MKSLPTLAFALALASSPLQAEDKLTQASGAELFAQLCASCHGPGGRGDGTVAAALKNPPPDLTRIAVRHGGFPEEEVYDMVDGRAMIPAHGSREMPVWGYELEARVPEEVPGRAGAQDMVEKLVAYLRSIQQPPLE